LLALSSEDFTADQLSTKLRENDPPIVARVEDGRVLLDLRTVFPEQDVAIANALIRICGK
jgi:L-seryl-tRNA(Ser) seleniumtransferase